MSFQKIILSSITAIFLLISTVQLSGCAGATIKVKVKEERPDGTVREFETEITLPQPEVPVTPPEEGGDIPGCLGTKEECGGEPGFLPTSVGNNFEKNSSDEKFDINDIKFILTANNSIHFSNYSGNLTVKLLNGNSLVSSINSAYYVQGNEIKATEPETVSEWYNQYSTSADTFIISIGDLDYSVDASEGEIVIETIAIYSSNELLGSNVRSYTYEPTAGQPKPPTHRF